MDSYGASTEAAQSKQSHFGDDDDDDENDDTNKDW